MWKKNLEVNELLIVSRKKNHKYIIKNTDTSGYGWQEDW